MRNPYRLTLLASCLLLCAAGSAAPVPLGHTATGQTITVAMVLPSRDPVGAADFVAHVSRPGDKLFHQYLTTAQYAARFGASQADYDAVLAWAARQGLTPGEKFASRHLILLSGPVPRLEAALAVHFNNFRDTSGHVYFAADARPALPAGVAAVIGLSNRAQARALVAPAPPRTAQNPSPARGLTAADLRKIYYMPATSFPKTRQTVAVYAQGGFAPQDIATYEKANQLPAVPIRVRNVNGYGGAINEPATELLAEIGIDMALAIDPALASIVVYETDDENYAVSILASLAAIAHDNTAKVVTLGYGLGESNFGTDQFTAENTLLTQLAAQGQTVLAASGDTGAYAILFPGVYDPASQPLVTGVGGTTLFVRGSTYVAEETWNGLANADGASGGGVSGQWPLPSWQKDTYGNVFTTANGGSSTMRNVPDVAALGDPRTGVAIYSALNGGWQTVGGTTVAAAIWSGLLSIANADSEGLGFGALGFVNPGLAAINGDGNRHFATDVFDIADGNNGDPTDYFGTPGFNAGFGYDNTTGWGSPVGEFLEIDLALLGSDSYSNPPAQPVGVSATATSTTATVKWTPEKKVNGYLVLLYSQTGGVSASRFVTGRTYTFAGLTPNTTYQAIVASVTAGGNTGSDRAIFTTAAK